MHHTPKTQFNRTEDFTSSDFMYRGAGCAAMTNWARAYMVFEPVNDEGLFRFVAAKRGQRIGGRTARQARAPGKPCASFLVRLKLLLRNLVRIGAERWHELE